MEEPCDLCILACSAFRFSAVAITALSRLKLKNKRTNQRTLSVVGICWYCIGSLLVCRSIYYLAQFEFRFKTLLCFQVPQWRGSGWTLHQWGLCLLPSLRHRARISWKPCAIALRALLLWKSWKAARYDFGPVQVPEGCVLVLGDNRTGWTGFFGDTEGFLSYIHELQWSLRWALELW